MIEPDRFRLYKSDRNSTNPISGYHRKRVNVIGIWRKVTDRIRWLCGTGILARPTGSDVPPLTWVSNFLILTLSVDRSDATEK
jgi:hypothetical protein